MAGSDRYAPLESTMTYTPPDHAVEAAARAVAALKCGTADQAGANLPDDIWRQAIPIAIAALAAYERAMWRPISTGDGEWVLAWDRKHEWRDRSPIASVRWTADGWLDKDGVGYGNLTLTHLRPLPPPPEGV